MFSLAELSKIIPWIASKLISTQNILQTHWRRYHTLWYMLYIHNISKLDIYLWPQTQEVYFYLCDWIITVLLSRCHCYWVFWAESMYERFYFVRLLFSCRIFYVFLMRKLKYSIFMSVFIDTNYFNICNINSFTDYIFENFIKRITLCYTIKVSNILHFT